MKSMLRILVLLALLAGIGTDPVRSEVDSPDEDLMISVSPMDNDIEVFNNTPDDNLTFNFFDEYSELITTLTMPTFSDHYYIGYFQHEVDIQPGYLVQVIDVATGNVAELLVKNITVDRPAIGSSILQGTAEANEQVEITINGDVPYHTYAQADEFSAWSKDIADDFPGFVFTDEMEIFANIIDDDGDRSFDAVYPCFLTGEFYYSTGTAHIYACMAGDVVSV